MTLETVTYKEAETLLDLISEQEQKLTEMEAFANMAEDKMKEIWERLN